MGKYVKARSATARPFIVIDAVHAVEPSSDGCVGLIAEMARKRLGCHVIISTISREVMDLNRPRSEKNARGVDAYRLTLQSMLQSAGALDADGLAVAPILHLAVHGMKDRGWALEVGTSPIGDGACSTSCRRWMWEHTQSWCDENEIPGVPLDDIVLNGMFSGDPSTTCHRHGDELHDYLGYGPNYHHFQLEFAACWREHHQERAVDYLQSLVESFESITAADPHIFDCDEPDHLDDWGWGAVTQSVTIDDGLPDGYFMGGRRGAAPVDDPDYPAFMEEDDNWWRDEPVDGFQVRSAADEAKLYDDPWDEGYDPSDAELIEWLMEHGKAAAE